MKDLVIRNKLLVGFIPVALLLFGFAVLAVTQMRNIYATAEELSALRLPVAKGVGQIDTATSDYLTAQRDEILDLDPATIKADQDRRLDRDRFAHETAARIRAIMRLQKSRDLLDAYITLWNQYRAATALSSELAAANKNVEALAVLHKAKPLYDRSQDKLVELTRWQQEVTDKAVDAATASYRRSIWLSGLAVALGVALLGGILVVLVRSVAKPVAEMTTALNRLSAGDMSVVVPDDGRADEVGKLAKAMAALRDQLNAAERAKEEQAKLIIGSIGDGLDKLAQGDLTARVDAELTGPFAKLKTDFNAAMDSLANTLGAVAQASGGVRTGAGEISQASDDLSQRTEQQAASLEETAAAMDEITTTVRDAAASAARANKAVAQARTEAEQSGTVVSRAIEAMAGIERASAEISEIITVIDGIAFQTNLLALNAGVEAARAGDAGKGFAVVASEVRALAQRSADAAKDVKSRITASSEQVDAGVSLVSETGSALQRIIAAIAEVDGLVGNIAESAEQQATGLQQVNTAVAEMDGMTQQNAAMVEQATAASRSLASEADALARQIGRFNLGEQAPAAPVRPANPVHELQARASRVKTPARPVSRGNTALAVQVDDDWSEF